MFLFDFGAQEEVEGGVWLVHTISYNCLLSSCSYQLLMWILAFRGRTVDFWAKTWGGSIYSCWMPTSSQES